MHSAATGDGEDGFGHWHLSRMRRPYRTRGFPGIQTRHCVPGFDEPSPWDEERKMGIKIRAAAPEWPMFLTAFGVCLLMFLQLRIADEFKDAAEDARWRPCRPVPRGLVSLKELRGVFILAALIQLVLLSDARPGAVVSPLSGNYNEPGKEEGNH